MVPQNRRFWGAVVRILDANSEIGARVEVFDLFKALV